MTDKQDPRQELRGIVAQACTDAIAALHPEGGYFPLDVAIIDKAIVGIDRYADQRVAEATRINTPCPACKRSTLIIGSGGYLVCGNLECGNPGAIDSALHQQQTNSQLRREGGK